MTRPQTALVVLNGDDVYEDLFSAGLRLQEILTGLGFATRTVMGTAGRADSTSLVVLYTAMGYFPPERQQALAEAVRAGTGLLAVHASNVFPAAQGRLDADYRRAFELIGSRYASHGPRPHESRFRVETSNDHELTRGLAPFEITHEHYQLELAPGAEVLAWRQAATGREPILHVREHGRGRVCYLQLGHDMRAWDDPPVRTLIARAALWAVSYKEAVAV
jgi:type 1 glutamine amidotransferase